MDKTEALTPFSTLTYQLATPLLSDILPHPDNRPISEAQVKTLSESIRKDGLGQLPLCRLLQNGKYQLLSGEHRWQAYKLLYKEDPQTYQRMPINFICDITDDRALFIMLVTNLYTSPLNEVQKGEAYKLLGRQVNKQRKKDPAMKGVPTSQLIAQTIEKETGQTVSSRTIERAIAASKAEEQKSKSVHALLPHLEKSWKAEAEAGNLTLDAIEMISAKDPREQKILFREAQEKKLLDPKKKNKIEYYLLTQDDSDFIEKQKLKTLETKLDTILKTLTPLPKSGDPNTLRSCKTKAAKISRLITEIPETPTDKDLPLFDEV